MTRRARRRRRPRDRAAAGRLAADDPRARPRPRPRRPSRQRRRPPSDPTPTRRRPPARPPTPPPSQPPSVIKSVCSTARARSSASTRTPGASPRRCSRCGTWSAAPRTRPTRARRSLYRLIRAHNRYRYKTSGNDVPAGPGRFAAVHPAALPVARLLLQDQRDQRDRRGHRPDQSSCRDHGPPRDPRLGRARVQVQSSSLARRTARSSASTSTGRSGPGSGDPWKYALHLDGVVPQGLRLLPRAEPQGHLGTQVRPRLRLTS